MKAIANLAIVVAVVSLVIGIISRLTMKPIAIVHGGGLQANALLGFTNTCLLFAIALMLLQLLKNKQ